ncbi:DUF3425 multi-domain protein [Pyrenophora tritici-repentis]|uniref:DUF3425 multi-domain protein n=2 Tax=Pyrenophora tritici-repentis TaxID=45151 RepID=A0A2W1HKG8_9PLEO|nr:uncharacterized protein PTRG_06828 [Pyrenophora tritici-repentis Pt-1C-BFP]KAA8613938.1 DUF3425 multi-domain protein [Pyrenophora tritici-repentis]EDU49748.1 hypothetical protein PTRG_06828 [Pyrenophora tritici-repentis Pt-1C-BFP]KAF7445657.1 DUF3425 multi-domain protein [Pyrenophora tritici-repentis]KAF7565950.1 DUF3425 multi-domain protein [Pyrenophora tritici-repentis]KAI1533610.1 repeatmulti-domain protein [Pyrenophora tritici-repentis]
MESSERWQSIAPASDEPGQRRPAPDRRKRRQAVAVACVQCRNGKAKCDGTRPRCNRCNDNDLTCQYDVAEGVSRAERMKIMKRDSITGELDDLKRIITSLRSGTDDHAAAVLARLRLGESPEDVAKSLPMTASPATSGQPPSLLGQESTDTSGSGMSHESAYDMSKATQKFPQNSAVSITSPTSQTAGWSPAASISSASFPPLAKGKQTPSGASASEQAFLAPLFDREDYLLAKEILDGESEEDDDPEDRRIDPRLLQHKSTFDVTGAPASSSNVYPCSQRPSPHRQHTFRSIYPTHLAGRQPIVNAVRVHHNLDIGHIFGNNMSFSNRFMSTGYPADNQDTNSNDFYLPTWAMLPINTISDPGSLRGAIPNMLREAVHMIQMGRPLSEVLEPHPNIAALFDEDVFNNSGILSKWAVGMVHGNTFTCFGAMYIFWYLMRWMISPSPTTYAAIPEWLRPTPNQLLMPHIKIVDFIVWPAFRELAVQIPAMQERMEWLMDMSINIQCDWSFSTGEALVANEETGQLDLCDKAKEAVRTLENWSVGPSFRGYVSNADSYVRIRTEGY